MKILLDESLPRKLRNDFGAEHEVWTVRDMGWLGKKNGELLRLMTENNYRNLPYQQNLKNLPLTVLILCAIDNRRVTLQKLIPKVFDQLAKGNLQRVMEIS